MRILAKRPRQTVPLPVPASHLQQTISPRFFRFTASVEPLMAQRVPFIVAEEQTRD